MRRGEGCRPGCDPDTRPRRRVDDDKLAGLVTLPQVAAVRRGSKDAPGVVASPVVTIVRASEQVTAAALVRACALAPASGDRPCLAGEHGGEERGQVDRDSRLPVERAVGVVLGRQPVELAVELAQLPLHVDQCRLQKLAFQTHGLAPSHPGVGDGDEHREVVIPTGQQGGTLGDEHGLQRGRPDPRRANGQPASGPRAAVPLAQGRVERDQRMGPSRRGVAEPSPHAACPVSSEVTHPQQTDAFDVWSHVSDLAGVRFQLEVSDSCCLCGDLTCLGDPYSLPLQHRPGSAKAGTNQRSSTS